MSKHPLCCTCDSCVGPGVKLAHAPLVHTTLGRPSRALKAAQGRAGDVDREHCLALARGNATNKFMLRNAYVTVIRAWRERTAA